MFIVTPILDFLFVSWFFWPLCIVILAACYTGAHYSADSSSGEFVHWPEFLLAILLASVAYRYPLIRYMMMDWLTWVVFLGVYLGLGFCLSTYKWMAVLQDFKKQELGKVIAKSREYVTKQMEKEHSPQTVEYRENRVVETLTRDYPRYNVVSSIDKDNKASISIYPNWKQYPIPTWWIYWPFFTLTVIFDPIRRIVDAITEYLKGAYNHIAKKFAITG